MQISPRDPEHLALPYHLRRLDALNRRPRRACRAGSLHCAQSSFDMTVIRFDPVIAVAPGPLTTSPGYIALPLKLANPPGSFADHLGRIPAEAGCRGLLMLAAETVWPPPGRVSRIGRSRLSVHAHQR